MISWHTTSGTSRCGVQAVTLIYILRQFLHTTAQRILTYIALISAAQQHKGHWRKQRDNERTAKYLSKELLDLLDKVFELDPVSFIELVTSLVLIEINIDLILLTIHTHEDDYEDDRIVILSIWLSDSFIDALMTLFLFLRKKDCLLPRFGLIHGWLLHCRPNMLMP